VAPGEAEKDGGGERDGKREVRALVEPRQLGQLVVAPLVDHLAEEDVRNVVGGRRALGGGRLVGRLGGGRHVERRCVAGYVDEHVVALQLAALLDAPAVDDAVAVEAEVVGDEAVEEVVDGGHLLRARYGAAVLAASLRMSYSCVSTGSGSARSGSGRGGS